MTLHSIRAASLGRPHTPSNKRMKLMKSAMARRCGLRSSPGVLGRHD
jgi:hypothetical protein